MSSFALPLIGAAGSVLGGLLGAGSAAKAGKTLANAGNAVNNNTQNVVQGNLPFISGAGTAAQGGVDAAKNQANDVLGSTFGGQTNVISPYLAAGGQGVGSLMTALQPGGSLTAQYQLPTAADVENTPGYQFQLSEGQKALQRSAAAAGGLMSGGTEKALDQYSQGLASTYYQNAVNNSLTQFQTNRNNTFQSLMGLAGFGLPAAAQYNQAAQNFGNMSAGNIMNAGQYVGNAGMSTALNAANYQLGGTEFGLNAYMNGQQGLAAGQMSQGNSYQGMINGITNAGGYAFGGGTFNPYGYGGGGSYMNSGYGPGVNPGYAGNPIMNSGGGYMAGAGPSAPPQGYDPWGLNV